MRKIIYTRPDGGITIVTPIRNTHPRPEDITEEEAEQRAWDALPKDAISPRWASDAEIPQDRTFRNAWKDTGTAVEHDMDKARAIAQDMIRKQRAPLLAELDVQFMQALESGAKTDAIVAEKQQLRDATEHPDVLAAATPEELKAAIEKAVQT